MKKPSKRILLGVAGAVLLGGSLPAAAIQVQGGVKPLQGARDAFPGKGGNASGEAAVMLNGVVDAVETEVAVVTINGLRYAMTGVPLHGRSGTINLQDLRPGSRVRLALAGPPNQRRVLAVWLVQ